ncbi:MAG: dTDP-4-dehydrorhamnose reductase [Candidatus Nitrotoga sp.]
MRKILLLGKSGQLGWELQRTLMPLGQIIALNSSELNLAQSDAIRQVLRQVQPNIIVNAAAYTAVDRAETEVELAMAINGTAPGILAEEAKKLNALLLHYSTDYIFDGHKTGAYVEDDTPNPLSVYGKTKLAGEQAIRATGVNHFIFRTSWVYGARGKNFLLTMLRLAQEKRELRIVNDQIGAPTWCRTIAEISAQVLAQLATTHTLSSVPGKHIKTEEVSGTYHLTAAGQVSWHDFATAIMRLAAVQPAPALIPIQSVAYSSPAARPLNSVLSNNKLQRVFNLSGGDWEANLKLCLAGLLESNSNSR